MRAVDIEWDIDINEALEKIHSMSVAEQAKTIEMNPLHYERLSIEHRDDHIRDYYHHRPGALLDLMQLPTEVELPDAVTDTEDIANYLSDYYGFCHRGFELQGKSKRSPAISNYNDLCDMDPGTFLLR